MPAYLCFLSHTVALHYHVTILFHCFMSRKCFSQRFYVEPDNISVSVYNKTDDFNFNVVSLTFPHSGIPEEVGYNVFYSQILRYGNICTSLDQFIFHLNKMFDLLLQRGYNFDLLTRMIRRCIRKYNNVFLKFGISDDNMILSHLTNSV